jgi:hypothetical protein
MNSEILYFGIPLISRKAAHNWDVVTRIFNSTLTSIFNQSNDNFRVLVGCCDVPTISPTFESKIEFITIDAPIPTTSAERMQDKGAKKQAIGRRLHELGGGYLMFMDADDLVHRELVSHVLRHQHPHGYLLKRGYEMDMQKKTLRRVKNFDQICGSCAVVRFDVDDLPSTLNDNQNVYFNQFGNHKLWHRVATEHNRPLAEIPFEAMIYVRNTGENYITQLPKLTFKQKLLALFKQASINERITKDFSLPAPVSL